METQPTMTAAPAKTPSRWKFIQRVMENPVILKELRGRMRGRQAFILLTFYLGLIGLVIGIVYMTLSAQASYMGMDPDFRQSVGKAIFGTVVLLELALVSFIGPALTAGAITSERERQTFDLLRTTTLPASSFVLGKLSSALAFLLLLIFTALPIESIAFLLGGVELAEIIVSSLLLVVTAVAYCTLGIFFSSFMKRTLAATVSSYGAIVLSFVLLGIAFFLLIYVDVALSSASTSRNEALAIITILFLWLLVSTNPLLTAIASEVVLVQEQSLVIFTVPLGNRSLDLLSPWIPFVIIYLLLTFIMIRLSINFVRRPDR
ncbi:MAG: ABC transporter permease subunit [Chloroflexota bacterium]